MSLLSRITRNVTAPLRALEELTRPPRRPFADLDEPLAEEPRPCDTGDCWHDAHGHVCPHHCFDDEPGLTGDELVGVRGLLQERYEPQTSASVKSTPGIGAEPNSPAASAAGDSPSEVCGHSPVPPSEGRPTSELLSIAADFLSIHASRTESGEKSRAYIRDTLLPELRARAEVFRRVEDEGHDVGVSWAAETFPQSFAPTSKAARTGRTPGRASTQERGSLTHAE